MYLGINLSHGSSACLVDAQGNLISAIEEERISRTKNHYGFPTEAVRYLIRNCPPNLEVQEVIHGAFQQLPEDSLVRILVNDGENPSNPRGSWKLPRPGWKRPDGSPHKLIETIIDGQLRELGMAPKKHIWIQHHDAHLGTALASSLRSNQQKSLLITLDGEGDGESGTVAVSSGSKFERLAKSSNLDSLGYLYQAVTEKYNFKGNQHEGKITGLAAFGKSSEAVDILKKYIVVENGLVKIQYSKSLTQNRLTRALKQIGMSTKTAASIEEIIDLSAASTKNYEDLAFAIQEVLEDTVVEILQYWMKRTDLRSLSVAGGVFANVKLNQRISEIRNLDFFDIFPNMGDGGLSAGGVWSHLSRTNNLRSKKPYSDMYLADQEDNVKMYFHRTDLKFEEFQQDALAIKVAELIAAGKFVGLHYGKMEFGPRALGHRSLLLDPRDKSILKSANDRLRRTEFMPFAPVVNERYFSRYFEGDLAKHPGFEFMTITCNVRSEVKGLIPAVTHIDGTARPQVLESSMNELYSRVLERFGDITGVHVLVNTSLNVHETPINFNLKDSLKCLSDHAIDFIATDKYLISLK
ncbi:MAG: hypothetical protein RJA33_24 [Actinomycetota bacterium]|jgi:carbamoyltransferase